MTKPPLPDNLDDAVGVLAHHCSYLASDISGRKIKTMLVLIDDEANEYKMGCFGVGQQEAEATLRGILDAMENNRHALRVVVNGKTKFERGVPS
jgi:hypothetical protein